MSVDLTVYFRNEYKLYEIILKYILSLAKFFDLKLIRQKEICRGSQMQAGGE